MLYDNFGRRIDYVRLSVTDRCDLRCQYCLPKGFKGFEEPENWLTFDEIERIIRLFTQMGVRRVRLTGGEPLLRRHIVELAARLATLPGLDDLSMTTNGTQLSRHAQALYDAGVHRLNISLDSLEREEMESITGKDSLETILNGIMCAKTVGFSPIKINMVAQAETAEEQINTMVAFCIEHGFILRLIEVMPMGSTGRNSGYKDLQPILHHLQKTYQLIEQTVPIGGGPARYWITPNGTFSLGLITPISQHFCDTCNRVRLSVDGTLFTCLGQEAHIALRPLLRQGISDAALEQAIRNTINQKPERHEFVEKPTKVLRFMSMTGG